MQSPTRSALALQSKQRKLRCLVVDDAPEVVRRLQDALMRVLPGATLLPAAQDGHEALRRIRDYSPNLILLGLDMPRMDGLTTLRALGMRRSVTTIAVASESLEGGRAAWEALVLGADDFITKRAGRGSGVEMQTCDPIDECLRRVIGPLLDPARVPPDAIRRSPASAEQIVGLSALVFLIETRSLRCIATWLSRQGSRLPVPIVLHVPHPARFTRAIHEGLDRLATMPVRIAVSGERLAPGHAVLVPGRCRAELEGKAGDLRLDLLPVMEPASPADLQMTMLHACLCQQSPPIGVAYADSLPSGALAPAREAAGQRRLFCLPIEGETGAESSLHVVEAFCPENLSGVLS